MIGNSFTHNAQPYSLPALADQQGVELSVGAHIKSGSPVHNIWHHAKNAREVSETYGKYPDALTKHRWDAVTLQPFYKKPYQGLPASTMQTDIDTILKFIDLTRGNPANSKTRFYLYTSWPFLWTGKPLPTVWDKTTPDELTALTMHTRSYYRQLAKRLRSKTDAQIHVIPVGEAICEMDKQMQAGDVPGFKAMADIMGDKLHLDHGLGHYLAGVTVYATVLGRNPAGLVKPKGHYDGKEGESKDALFTPEVLKILHDTVWRVVTACPDAGVAAGAAP